MQMYQRLLCRQYDQLIYSEALSNLSYTTKPILLDSLLQEVTAGVMYVCINIKLYILETEDLELVSSSYELETKTYKLC